MKKILVVEDELAYVKLLHDQLTANGYRVIEAGNGKTGLDLAKKEKPDLILLDIRMPDMDGLTMLKLLRQDKAGKSAKVILLTNLEANDKIVSDVVETEPLYYFVKSDVKMGDVIKKIGEMLAK